jgi:hypothetical protein
MVHVCGIALLAFLVWSQAGYAAEKRVAVLSFEDKSGFDSPDGCGCLPTGPFGWLFGKSRRQREVWNLGVGFQDMLLTTFQNAPGYEIVTADELLTALGELGIQRRDLRRKEARLQLCDRLNASFLVTGTIRTFKQERARGIIERDLSGGTGSAVVAGAGGLSTSIGATANFYRASVAVDFVAYGVTGEEAFASSLSESENYQLGAILSGPLEARISDEGASAYIGSQPLIPSDKAPPIVRHETLDRVKFGTPGWDSPPKSADEPTYRRTLLGRVTQNVLNAFVEKTRERVGPALEDVLPKEVTLVVGKVVMKPENSPDFYVNLGVSAGIRNGDRLRVFQPGDDIKDPETGEVLGSLETEAGLVEVVEVMRPKLSRVRVVSGDVALNYIVKTIPQEPTPPVAPEK